MVQVKISDGVLEGEKVQNDYGGSFYSFKGIPYAKPPLGDLRFKAPQPVDPWHGVREAKEEGPQCIQFDIFLTQQTTGQEDCLYLNVYTPNLQPKQQLPVMVWIHGGGFITGSGSSNLYGPDFLINKDIVLVTFNYRLGALGFLCLNTEEIPGNAGMKDQVEALRWVKKNINFFGGDSNNVTIFGESAGSASVSYHLISPMSAGLFRRAILQSGALPNYWTICEQPRQRGIALAKKLGCLSEDDKELAAFLKNVPAESLVNVKLPIVASEDLDSKTNLWYAIVNEKQFNNCERFYFEDEHENKIPNIHKNVEVIIGYTEHEGILAFMNNVNFDNMLEHLNHFKDFYVPPSIAYRTTLNEQIEIGNKIKKYYFKEDIITKQHIKQLLQFQSMSFFIYGIIVFARMIAKNNNKVYLYKFTCKTQRNIFTNLFRASSIFGEDEVFVSHADDLLYLFPFSIIPVDVPKDSVEYENIQSVTTLWTNFAKYGNPTPTNDLGVKWPTFTLKEQEYLNLGNRLAVENHPEKEDISFWDTIYEKFMPSFVNI